MSQISRIVLTILLAVNMGAALGQARVDSLQRILEDAKPDSTRVKILIDLGRALFSTKPREAIQYSEEAEELAREIDYMKGAGYARKNKGLVYYSQGNYTEALVHWNESLKIFSEIEDQLGQANMLNNIGAIYTDKGDYVSALDYYLKSLKLSEQLRDSLRMATALSNIGLVYKNDPNTLEKALEFYERSLEMSKAIGDNEAIGSSALNLGELFMAKGNYDEALRFFLESEHAYRSGEEISQYLPNSLLSIGKVHGLKGDYGRATKYIAMAVDFSREYGLKLRLVQALTQMGETNLHFSKYDEAIKYYLEAEDLATDTGAKLELKSIYEGLSTASSRRGDFRDGYKYQQALLAIKDTLYSDDNSKKLERLQFSFDLEKKESQITLLTKNTALKELELEQQRFSKNALMAGLGVAFLVGIILLRNYQTKLRSNRLLAKQNTSILLQKEEIEGHLGDIEKQKQEIETLMLNILPVEVAQELRKNGTATPRYYESVTVLFTDFKEFTRIAETMPAHELVEQLNACFIAFDGISEEYGLEKIKTIGDAYMCACGIPTPVEDHPIRTVRAAMAIQQYIEKENRKRREQGTAPWEIRIGIHTGPIVAGVVGRKKFAYDIWGNAVNIANRLESNGKEGCVNISDSTYQLIKDRFECTYRGKILAKNLGQVDMYFVVREIETVDVVMN
jgi:adenylate cyclase